MHGSQGSRKSRLEEFLRRPKRAVWVMAAPLMGGLLLHTAYMIVDTAFVGQLAPEALAALTFVGPLFFISIALVNGIATGVTAVVSQAIGRKDAEGADLAASNALSLGMVAGGLFLVGGLLFGPDLLAASGAEGASASLAWDYFSIIVIGSPLFFLGGAMRAVLTGEGDAATPMMIMAASTVLNIALDPVFIFVADMGIRGAALATILSQIVALSGFAYLLFVRRRSFVRFSLRGMRLKLRMVTRILGIGLPTSATMLIMSVGFAFFNKLLTSYGQMAVAGYGAGSKVDMFVSMPIMGVASATVAVIGMFAGARRVDLVRSTTLYALKWGLFFAVTLGSLVYLSSHWVMGLFTEDQRVVAFGTTYLGYMIFAYPLMAIGMTTGRILQGLGYGVPALVITAVRVLLISAPVAYVAVVLFEAPIDAVWLSLIAGGFTSNILSVVWIRHYVWKRDPTARASRGAGAPPAERDAVDEGMSGTDGVTGAEEEVIV